MLRFLMHGNFSMIEPTGLRLCHLFKPHENITVFDFHSQICRNFSGHYNKTIAISY